MLTHALAGPFATETLSGNKTFTRAELDAAPTQKLDPGGSGRDVTLPAEADSRGLVIAILNTADAAEVLTIKDDGGSTLGTPTQNEGALCWCDGTTWAALVGATN